jgi:hypothetical protein
VLGLACVECGAESDGLAPGWRAFLVDERDDDEQEQEILMFLPAMRRVLVLIGSGSKR